MMGVLFGNSPAYTLSMNGDDSIENVCAVCPNCHRKLHFGPEREKITKSILKVIFNRDDNIT